MVKMKELTDIIQRVPDLKIYSDKDEITFCHFPWKKDPVQYIGFGERGDTPQNCCSQLTLSTVSCFSKDEELPLMIVRADAVKTWDRTREYVSAIDVLHDRIILKGA